MTPAILLVSFGTAVPATRKKTLDAIERDIRSAYPDHYVYHAWTSRMLREKVYEKEHISIPDLSEALEHIAQSGAKTVLVQPTFVSEGTEYQEMIRELTNDSAQYDYVFDHIYVGNPLLKYPESVIEAVMSECIPPAQDEFLVFMGHGTADGEDTCYEFLNKCFHSAGYPNVFLKTMKSSASVDEVIRLAKERKITRITLAPFMIVAGAHALKDMSGDNETSWKTQLESAGYSVVCILKGLGEYTGIRQLLVQNIKDSCIHTIQ